MCIRDRSVVICLYLVNHGQQIQELFILCKSNALFYVSAMSSEQPAFTTKNVLQSSLELSKQTELALQRTEAQLMTAVHLKEQRNSIEALTARQAQLLETQEKHITTMLGQHLKKQSEAEARLEAQNQRIGALMQVCV